MVWFEKLFAGVVIAVCLVLLVRLCLTARTRHRLDGWSLRSFYAARRAVRQTIGWRARRRHATRTAEEAIERARRGSWEGNVYSAKSFKDKPRKPH